MHIPIFGGCYSKLTTSYTFFPLLQPDQPASERDWGTAAAVSACVEAGVDIVRVHNVTAMTDVVNVANAIWRLDTAW